MLKLFSAFKKVLCEHFSPTRCYAKKILPADPSHVESIPVDEITIKSHKEVNLYGWGLGEHGALGFHVQKSKKMNSLDDPRFRVYNRPLRLAFGEYHKVKDIAAGYGFSVMYALSKNQHKVYGTGLNTDSQIGYHQGPNSYLEVVLAPVPIPLQFKQPTKTKVISMGAGRAHLVIVTDLEGIFALGNNSYGQCGRRVIQDEEYAGSRIVHKFSHFPDDPVKSVECGQDHTLLLTESGKVYSFGWGADGQTGLGHYKTQSSPQRVLGDIENEKIVKLSSKCDCVLALNDKGDVFGWGNSEYSQLFGSDKPLQQINRPIHLTKCQGFGKIIDVAAAGSYCMMLNEAGDVFTWGYGILGQGPKVNHSWNPQVIPPILFGRNDFHSDSTVKSIYCGINFSAAITNYGDVYTWGKNKGRCLGLVEKFDHFFPSRVCIGARAMKLALGVDHVLAMCHPF